MSDGLVFDEDTSTGLAILTIDRPASKNAFMMVGAQIPSIDCDPATNTQTYDLPDGRKLRIGNGIQQAKGIMVLDAMKPESVGQLREILEISTKVKK